MDRPSDSPASSVRLDRQSPDVGVHGHVERADGTRPTAEQARPLEASAPGRSTVALLDADRAFADVVDPADRALARQLVRVPRLHLPEGPWQGPQAVGAPDVVGLVVLEGLISHTTSFDGRIAVELSGPGDVLGLGSGHDGGLGADLEHIVVQPAAVAVLGERFVSAARRWPALWRVLVERAADRADRLMLQVAILQLSRVERRVLAELWQLADRFGRVTPKGVVVPIPLTHETIGRLVGARRPTVTLALGELASTGAVQREADGSWLLDPESRP